MERIDCLKLLAPMITDELVAIGIAGVNWEWRSLSKHEGNMTIGSLGHTLAVGTGMALSLPHRRVIVLESDGSSLADLPCLTTIGTYRPPNLKVFVFDNELYSGSRISDPSATAYNTDLEQMARGAFGRAAFRTRFGRQRGASRRREGAGNLRPGSMTFKVFFNAVPMEY